MADTALPSDNAGAQPRPGAAPEVSAPPAEQPYQALYRRYRPKRFADVLGQEHVTRALQNAVREEHVAHAYLLSGPRGTGKTSTARILAMALNCEAPLSGEPDGTCPSCTSIRSGASMDVFELDAASNRKLDEMRDLLSRVALGTPGRWKVYIIDEVHQLTADAASALLKTLEEPPSHVVFVLATTDPQRVLPTILSRTQHFEFHLLDGEVLSGLLSDINLDAGLGLSPQALELAVERGRGSARDAESALEQLAAAAGDSEDFAAPMSELMEALAQRDVGQTLRAAARAVSSGREPRRLGSDLVDYLRNAFLAHQAPTLVLLPPATTAQLAEQAQQMGLPFLVRCMETLGQSLVDMRDSVDPRVTLEVALIRLASPVVDTSPGALLERVERLERALAEKNDLPAPRPDTGTASPPGPAPAGPAQQARAALGAYLRGNPGGPSAPPPVTPPLAAGVTPSGPAVSPVQPSAGAVPVTRLPTRDELTKAWGDSVLGKLTRPAQVYMASGRFTEVSGGTAVFALPDRGLVTRATNFVAEAETALAGHFGRPVPLRLVVDNGATAVRSEPGPAVEEDTYDLDDLGELAEAPPVPAVSVEQRLLQAFPGSVLDG